MRHDHDDAACVGELAQHLHHLLVQRGVQSGRRLVEHEQRRTGQQLQCDRRTFALPARQLVDAGVRVRRQLEFLEHLRDHALPVLLGGVRRHPQFRRVAQRLVDGELPMHDVVLRNHADPGAHRRVLGVDVVRFEQHRTAVRPRAARDHVQQRGLARTRRADHRGQRGRLDGERNTVQQCAIACDGQADVAHLEATGLVGGFDATDEIAVLEHKVDVADRDDVVLPQRRVLDAMAVDERAIGAVGVLYLHTFWRRHQRRVMVRGQHIWDHDVVSEGAADPGRRWLIPGRRLLGGQNGGWRCTTDRDRV